MSLDINLTNVQAIPIVVNANITAENNKVYHVIANATFTDPTPVEGRGYVVIVRNGSATIGGSVYPTTRIIYRIYQGGGWQNYEYRDAISNINTFVPQTRTINGLDLSANRTFTTADIADSVNKRYVTDANLTLLGNTSGTNTGDQDLTNLVVKNSAITGATKTKITYDAKGLVTAGADATTADIADSSNKRYVTDANLTVIGNTSNTNTGDETQASILSKLGVFYLPFTPSSAVTGTTSETQVAVVTIPANTIRSIDNLRIYTPVVKSGTSGICTVTYKLSTSATMPSGTTDRIAVATGATGSLWIGMSRNASYNGGNLIIANSGTALVLDLAATAQAPTVTARNNAVTLYLYISITLGNATDSAYLSGGYITNN